MKPPEQTERVIKTIIKNRRAWHDYEIVQSVEAGIVLLGTEVKSLRAGKCNVADAYASFPSKSSTDLYLVNFNITPYEHGTHENHEPRRQRKLLLNRREAAKLFTAVQEKGMTLIPLSLYFSGCFVKVELGLVKAKKKYDKRESAKEKEHDREIRRKFRT